METLLEKAIPLLFLAFVAFFSFLSSSAKKYGWFAATHPWAKKLLVQLNELCYEHNRTNVPPYTLRSLGQRLECFCDNKDLRDDIFMLYRLLYDSLDQIILDSFDPEYKFWIYSSSNPSPNHLFNTAKEILLLRNCISAEEISDFEMRIAIAGKAEDSMRDFRHETAAKSRESSDITQED